MITEILHCGDNLDYMKSLQSENIDLIYGDILLVSQNKILSLHK